VGETADHEPFEQVLRRNRGRLAGIAAAYAEREAEDLLQEILLQLWRSQNGFQQRSGIDTWCYRVALNTAISWQRRHQRRRLPPEALDLDQLSAPARGDDAPALLQAFMRTLSEVDRALLVMYLDDLSGDEMAQALGIRVGAVRVRLHRIKSALANWKAGDE
jgi:RNA polymerase sigma-70 factor (ECF subfamily)